MHNSEWKKPHSVWRVQKLLITSKRNNSCKLRHFTRSTYSTCLSLATYQAHAFLFTLQNTGSPTLACYPALNLFVGKNTNISLHSTNRTCDPTEEGETQEALETHLSDGNCWRLVAHLKGTVPWGRSQLLQWTPTYSVISFSGKNRLECNVNKLDSSTWTKHSFLTNYSPEQSRMREEERDGLGNEVQHEHCYHRPSSSFIFLVLINDSEINCRNLVEQ